MEYNWSTNSYRVIPDWSDYVMGPRMDVWSLPRQVPCKGGKTRQLAAKQLKPENGRVTFSRGSETQRYHIARDLYPKMFPELVVIRPSPLFITSDIYSRHCGIHGRIYSGLPVRPAFRERHLLGDLIATAHGFKVTKHP